MDVSYLPLHCHPPKHSVFLSQTITKLHRIVGRIVSSQLCISVCLVTVQCHFSWWWCQEEWKIASVEGFLESAIWHHCRTSPTDLPKSIPLKSHLPSTTPYQPFVRWDDASAPYVHILIWRETKWILGLIHRHRRCTTKTTTDVWQRQPATSPYHPRGKHRYCIFVAVVALWNRAQIKKIESSVERNVWLFSAFFPQARASRNIFHFTKWVVLAGNSLYILVLLTFLYNSNTGADAWCSSSVNVTISSIRWIWMLLNLLWMQYKLTNVWPKR